MKQAVLIMLKDKQVTLKDIAGELGLSVKAVSTGINGTGRLSPDTRQRILDKAWEMGYTPNVAARSLVTGSSYLIGVMVPYLGISFFGHIIAGIEKIAHEHNFLVLLADLPRDTDKCRQVIESFKQRKIDGLIAYPGKEFVDIADDIRKHRIPLVQIMNRYPQLGSHSVTIDNFAAGYAAAEHLIKLGHRHIGIITHDAESSEITKRHLGFAEAMRQLLPDAGLASRECALSTQDGYAATKILLAENPELTAIFAVSDLAALGTVKAALEAGRRIPDEFAVIGFDDLEIASEQLFYPLTTMAQPKEQVGTLAGKMMFDLLSGQKTENIILDAPLIERGTTKRIDIENQ